jgi:hypothetical protein
MVGGGDWVIGGLERIVERLQSGVSTKWNQMRLYIT